MSQQNFMTCAFLTSPLRRYRVDKTNDFADFAKGGLRIPRCMRKEVASKISIQKQRLACSRGGVRVITPSYPLIQPFFARACGDCQRASIRSLSRLQAGAIAA